jgi:GWxTD domain-containing protein
MKKYSSAILIVLMVTGITFVAQGQTDLLFRGGSFQRDDLLVDHTLFYEPDSALVRLEVYWQVFNRGLVFKADGDKLRATYETQIRIMGDDEHQADSYKKSSQVVVDDRARATSPIDFRTNQANFLLPEGKYEIQLTLRDGNSGKAQSRNIKVKIKTKDFRGSNPRLSELELVNAVLPPGETASPFDKANLRVVPSLTGEFGDLQFGRLRFYMEIYKGSGDIDDVVIETAIRKEWGGLEYRDSLTSTLEESVTRQFREISLENMTPGDYRLEVRLRGRRMKELDKRECVFHIEWSQETLLQDGYKTLVNLLRLVATRDQVKSLEKAETVVTRQAALDTLWLAWDPTPGTAENEIRGEFFRRVKVANRTFSFMRQQGWQTDRGVVYIKHGQPDEIDDAPMSMDSYPYQEWHYHRGGIYRKFTFVDRNGDGDFRLTYPYDGLNLRPDF